MGIKRGGQLILRNAAGLIALLGIHYISDRYYFEQRTGISQVSPYFFLLLLYAWIVFHNQVLFERYYLGGKKKRYVIVTLLVMAISSVNMYLVLTFFFDDADKLSMILSFWVYTLAGLGVFVIFRYLEEQEKKTYRQAAPADRNMLPYFEYVENGYKEQIPVANILYVESLENYIKLITSKKSYLIRMSLKETEDRLPRPAFLRISRSHIVNTAYSTLLNSGNISVNDKQLKIGKVYKRYVEEYLRKGM